MSVRVANAPLSYGAFEMTVGTDFAVPDPERVLAAIGDAGYAGTDLGPPGYLGEGDVLARAPGRQRARARRRLRPDALLRARRLGGGRCAGLHHTLDLFDAAGATGARPVLCDAGGPERIANPGRGGEDASLRLDDARWRQLVEGVARAADAAREPRLRAGLPPPHLDLRRGGRRRSSACSRTPTCALLLDSGHLAVAGGDPVAGARATGATGSARSTSRTCGSTCSTGVKAERADTLTAWRRGLFCALGEGDVDLDGLLRRARGPRLRRLGRRRAGPRARRRRRVRRRRRRAGRATATGCASTQDGEHELRRHHDGPHRRRRLPAADRRLAARGRVVRQVPRRQPDQRRRGRRPLRPLASP